MFTKSKLIYQSLFNSKLLKPSSRQIRTTPVVNTFWIRDEKGGYRDNRKFPPLKERIREGLKELKKEVELWSHEVKDHFESDPIMVYRPGETDVKYQFKNEDSLKTWVVSSDSDNNEGYSKCSLSITPNGKGLFAGDISTRVPKDGRVKRAGYCNIKTITPRKSFKRETYLDWTPYNVLVLRVRGDGRSYLINIGTKGYYDITWNDMFHFVLYTRGGPYWQLTKIPFSKFFLSSRGRIQDRQCPIALNKISSFGISAGDKVNGPFSLEIDYIGMEFDPKHEEEFAYEMYDMPAGIVAT